MQFLNYLKGVWQRLFPLKDIKQALGIKPAITDDMLSSIELWQNCFSGNAPWLNDDVISLRLEQSITRSLQTSRLTK